ncbi:acyltransferase [Flavobacterium sp.]|uniref:acyltransferase family protein n=1 Tax=Flavobacterium sp. TaxID=239 RepID=UPI00286DE5A5|nr:acyltransferase [Flavobacterium sp.]
MENNQRIFGLDLMRATAILMVLCSHSLWIYPESSSLGSQILKFFGFFGVEIFFVLSGFLIGTILYKLYTQQDFTFKTAVYFIKRRGFRTLPNYFLVLFLNIGIAAIIGYSVPDIGFYFLFLQNFSSTMLPFFPESWSLSVEEFAYLLTPLLLLFASVLVKSNNKSKQFICVVLLLVFVFLIHKIIYYFNTSNTTLEQWNISLKEVVIYRVDSILIGVIAAWASFNFPIIWQKNKINFLFLGFFGLMLLFFGIGYFKINIETNSFFWNVLYLPITSMLFALFLPLLSQWEVAPKWFLRPITFISLISYSIYLLHYSVVLQLMKHLIDTSLFTPTELNLFTFTYIIFTFIFSWFLYRFFETPMTKLRD